MSTWFCWVNDYFLIQQFSKISGNVISKGGDNLKVHAAKFSTLSCPVLLYRSKSNFPHMQPLLELKNLAPVLSSSLNFVHKPIKLIIDCSQEFRQVVTMSCVRKDSLSQLRQIHYRRIFTNIQNLTIIYKFIYKR